MVKFISNTEDRTSDDLTPGKVLILDSVMFNHLKDNPDKVPDEFNNYTLIETSELMP